MKIAKRILALLLICIFVTLPLGHAASAASLEDYSCYDAEILEVRGGAGGIVSMTFDDGYYETALIVAELARKYNLAASIMMTSLSFKPKENYGEGATLATWQELFASSPLEPQSHTMNHANFMDEELQTEEDFRREFAEWRDTLEGYFPDYDVITLAMPYGRMSEAAVEYASGVYYAIRSTTLGVQTLDPGFSSGVGSWSNLYSPIVRLEGADEEQQLKYIKRCIAMNENGWYAPIIHRVGEHEISEMSYELTEAMFAHIASLRDEGKVWVTTFSEATKYIRERQNSTAKASREQSGEVRVWVDMADTTADGLALDAQIFDTPLTVKVELSDIYDEVYYTVRGVEYHSEVFVEGGKRYAFVDIIPDGEQIRLRSTYSHEIGEWGKYDETSHVKECVDCGMLAFAPHTPDAGVVVTPSTHMVEGVREHTCTVCGEDSFTAIAKTEEHTFNCESTKGRYLISIQTCTEGRKYYYSCECGECGTETFYSTEPLGHEVEWRTVREASDTVDGIEELYCRRCQTSVDRRIIPMTGAVSPGTQPNTEPDEWENLGPIIAASVGTAVSVGALSVFLIIRKKRK